jgi:signal transduction histidine kinase/ActR/RegA family two-component response regulator
MEFVEFPAAGNLYQFVAERLRDIVGDTSIIAVTGFDRTAGLHRLQTVLGLEQYAEQVRIALGRDMMDMTIMPEEPAGIALRSGRLTRLPEGVVELANGEWPPGAIAFAQDILEVTDIFGIGFVREELVYGGVVFVQRKGAREIDRAVVEAFVGQATAAISRRRSEDALRERDAQLRQSQKLEAVGVLAGGIAHDFNNTLGAIIGYSELVLGKTPPGTRAHHNLEQVVIAGRRAADLVRQILAFSRQCPTEKRPLELRPIINEALKLLRATLPTTIAFESDLQQDGTLVNADPPQMHQVFMNLCTNAAHAMRGSHGTLAVTLKRVTIDEHGCKAPRPPAEYVLLRVADTGIGMDPLTMEHMFDPFFTTKEPGEGSGMGLAVVHGIVEDHGGFVSVTSSPGKGTRVDVYLPAAHAPPGGIVSEIEQAPHGAGERLLFVDDEAPLGDLSAELLRELGYQVDAYADSTAALSAFEAHPEQYDLVITDMTMPRLTGLQLAERCLAKRSDIPVVLCTGYSDVVSPERARAAGIRRYLAKPLGPVELGRAVREVLDEKQQ